MVSILSTKDIQRIIAQRLKEARLSANLTQQGLASRSGVSLGSLKRFEGEGEISLKGLVSLAFALRMEDDFITLFEPKRSESLDSMLSKAAASRRQRGRKT
jgi:transcriptional regulator with XRE-family HTH domain